MGFIRGGNITTFGCLTRVYGLTILAPIVEKPSPIACNWVVQNFDAIQGYEQIVEKCEIEKWLYPAVMIYIY
jgi:hypothetical protein